MNKEAVFSAHFEGNLSDRLEEGLGLDVADGAADFGYNDVGVGLLADAVDKFLDFVCNVRNDLNGGAEIFAPALLVEHVPVYLSGGEVGKTVEVLVDKSLIVSEVKVGFGAVLGDLNLAVLIGAHCAGVDIYIGVELLSGNLKPSRL